MKGRSRRDSAIRIAVQEAKSVAEVLRHLGMRVGGGNYATIHRAVRELGLNTSHWTGQGHRKGTRIPVVPARPLREVLVRDSLYKSNHLRVRLIREGVFPPKCASCLGTEWLGRPIPLEVDHRDGDRLNNELSNPIAVSQLSALTPTYRGRNVRLRKRRIPRNIRRCPGGEMVDAGDL
jgi:hypothetical protein